MSLNRPHAYQLRYAWTCWTARESSFPNPLPQEIIGKLPTLWETDGLHALEWDASPRQLQLLFSARPGMSPAWIAQRAKGRLQHAFRATGLSLDMQRNFRLASVGAPKAAQVDAYLREQLQHGDFADPRYRDALEHLAFEIPEAGLTDPIRSAHAEYVLAYHIVLVTADRWRMPSGTASKIAEALRSCAVDQGGTIAKASLMPDHVHLAVKGRPTTSPAELAGEIRQVTGNAAGTQGFWMPSGYLGTFGPYGMGAIRRRVRGGGRS